MADQNDTAPNAQLPWWHIGSTQASIFFCLSSILIILDITVFDFCHGPCSLERRVYNWWYFLILIYVPGYFSQHNRIYLSMAEDLLIRTGLGLTVLALLGNFLGIGSCEERLAPENVGTMIFVTAFFQGFWMAAVW